MTKAILSGAIALSLAAAAHAQSVETSPESTLIRRSRWTWSGWGGTGYGGFTTGYSGYGYGYGYGYYGGTVGVDYYGYGAGSLYGGAGYYRSYGFRRPIASADAAGPGVRSGPVADRLAEFTSAREIEAGRACLKSGDYRGAVDQFRSAVAAHTENPVAQAWFAVVLAITGDVKNADKALRAAAAAGFPLDRVTLADAFRDEKERVRVIVALAKASGDGSLAVAFALSQAGEAVPLKKLSEKDPVAKQLLPKP